MTTIVGPTQIGHVRMITLRAALALEIRHPELRRSRGPAITTIIRRTYGLPQRKRRALYAALNELVVKTLGPNYHRELAP